MCNAFHSLSLFKYMKPNRIYAFIWCSCSGLTDHIWCSTQSWEVVTFAKKKKQTDKKKNKTTSWHFSQLTTVNVPTSSFCLNWLLLVSHFNSHKSLNCFSFCVPVASSMSVQIILWVSLQQPAQENHKFSSDTSLKRKCVSTAVRGDAHLGSVLPLNANLIFELTTWKPLCFESHAKDFPIAVLSILRCHICGV